LAMLNDGFVRTCSGNFARRLQGLATADNLPSLVRASFRLALGREPSDYEHATCVQFIQAQTEARTARGEEDALQEALTDFCQSLFCLNEFVYVD
jgi:hypothetical protein